VRKKCSSYFMILRHFGTNSTEMFKASVNDNKNFGITQPERLVKLWNHSAGEAGETLESLSRRGWWNSD
jgi:hypothetical protein